MMMKRVTLPKVSSVTTWLPCRVRSRLRPARSAVEQASRSPTGGLPCWAAPGRSSPQAAKVEVRKASSIFGDAVVSTRCDRTVPVLYGSKTPGGAGTHTRQTQEPHKPTSKPTPPTDSRARPHPNPGTHASPARHTGRYWDLGTVPVLYFLRSVVCPAPHPPVFLIFVPGVWFKNTGGGSRDSGTQATHRHHSD